MKRHHKQPETDSWFTQLDSWGLLALIIFAVILYFMITSPLKRVADNPYEEPYMESPQQNANPNVTP